MSKKTREKIIEEWKELGILSKDLLDFYNMSHDEKANLQVFEDLCKKHNGHCALLFSDDEICDNKELVLVASKYGIYGDYHLLSSRLLNDPDIAIALAHCNKYEYTNISKAIRDNADLMLETVKINPNLYCSLPVNVKIDKRILLEIAQRDPHQLFLLRDIKKEYKEIIQNDKELALIVAGRDASCLPFFSDRILLDIDIQSLAFSLNDEKAFRKAISNNLWALKYVNSIYWAQDKKLIELALKENGSLLKEMPEIIRSDKKYALIAVKSNSQAIQYCSTELLDDEEIIMKALQADSEEILSYASERIRGLYEVVYKAVSVDALNLQYASDELRDNRDIVLRAVKTWGGSLEDASERLQKDDELKKISRKNM